MPTVTQKSVKIQEQSLILPRPILAPHLPGSPFHTGFGTEVLSAEHFYPELILPLWYEWTGQCSCIQKNINISAFNTRVKSTKSRNAIRSQACFGLVLLLLTPEVWVNLSSCRLLCLHQLSNTSPELICKGNQFFQDSSNDPFLS